MVHSLEASLWAFHRAGTFEEAVLSAVNLVDDADTTGAVCGQFAGAYWGESGVPQRWRDGLVRRDLLEQALQGIDTLIIVSCSGYLFRPARRRVSPDNCFNRAAVFLRSSSIASVAFSSRASHSD